MTNSGYNRCMGRYPFWREGLYWGSTFGNHPLANNDWKRPIYFTGGSYSDSEYIWMIDYLQLDGFVFKLVPI